MKVLTVFLFLTVFLYSSLGGASSPYEDYLDDSKNHIDLDGDGYPDVLRDYKDGQLMSEVFKLSTKPESWKKTTYLKGGAIRVEFYRGDELYKTEVDTPTRTGYDLDVTYHQQERRTLKSVRNLTLVTSHFGQGKGGWVLVGRKTTHLEKVYKEVTSGASGHADGDYSEKGQLMYQEEVTGPLGYRLGPACRGEVKNKLIKVTHYFFKSLLPCLGSYHPLLAAALASNIKRSRNVVRCNKIHVEGGAYTFTMRNAPISLQAGANPVALMSGRVGVPFSETMAINSVANTLLHESLHNLGIVHSHGGTGKLDPAYGCEEMCNTSYKRYPGLSFIGYQRGCQQCMSTRVNGQRGDLNQCRR